MTVIQDYLEKNGVSMYKVAKDNGIAKTTIFNASKKELDSLSFKNLRAIANSLDKTVGEVADELNRLDVKNEVLRKWGNLAYISATGDDQMDNVPDRVKNNWDKIYKADLEMNKYIQKKLDETNRDYTIVEREKEIFIQKYFKAIYDDFKKYGWNK